MKIQICGGGSWVPSGPGKGLICTPVECYGLNLTRKIKSSKENFHCHYVHYETNRKFCSTEPKSSY
jgi:hypothetical protein